MFEEIISNLCWLAGFFAFLWVFVVRPGRARELIITEALKTYHMELEAGVEQSRLPAMLGQKRGNPPAKGDKRMNITLDFISGIELSQDGDKCRCVVRSAAGITEAVLENGQTLNIRQSRNPANILTHCPYRSGSGGWGGAGGIGMASGRGGAGLRD